MSDELKLRTVLGRPLQDVEVDGNFLYIDGKATGAVDAAQKAEQLAQDFPVKVHPMPLRPGMPVVFRSKSGQVPMHFDQQGTVVQGASRILGQGKDGVALDVAAGALKVTNEGVVSVPGMSMRSTPSGNGTQYFTDKSQSTHIWMQVNPDGSVNIWQLLGYASTAELDAVVQRVAVLEAAAETGAETPVDQMRPVFVGADGRLMTLGVNGKPVEYFDPNPYSFELDIPVHWFQRAVVAAWNRPAIGPTGAVAIARAVENSDIPALTIPADPNLWLIVVVHGQSNAPGAQGLPLLPPYDQPFESHAWMLGGTGVGCRLVRDDTGAAVGSEPIYDPAVTTELVPLQSTQYGSRGVTLCEGFAAYFHPMLRRRLGYDINVVYINGGYGGRLASALAKGTIPYENILRAVQRAKELIVARGGVPHVPFALCAHGESNAGTSAYRSELVTWQGDFEGDAQAITGQLAPIPFVCSQASTFAHSGSAIQSRAVHGVLAPFDAARTYPGKFIVAGPYYPDELNADNLHRRNRGHFRGGEYMAMAVEMALFGGRPFGGLEPVRVEFDGGRVLTLTVAPVYQHAVIDNTNPNNPPLPDGFHGIEVFGGDGEPVTINSVTDNGDNTYTVTTAEDVPAGEHRGLGYGLRGFDLPKVNGQGPRGQIRDGRLTPSGVGGEPLYHWMCHFFLAF